MATRTLSVKNLMSKRFSTLDLGEEYAKCFGEPSDAGIWMIFGKEKNGKQAFQKGQVYTKSLRTGYG